MNVTMAAHHAFSSRISAEIPGYDLESIEFSVRDYRYYVSITRRATNYRTVLGMEHSALFEEYIGTVTRPVRELKNYFHNLWC